MHRLLLLGLNHTTAPIEVRERLAFGSQDRASLLRTIRAQHAEGVLLSTCNRVELYLARPVHGHPRSAEAIDLLAMSRNLPADLFRAHLYEKTDRDAVEHLFSVACSLDSMVLGETQILGQVREAYDASVAVGAAGAMLNSLFQRALAVGKQVMHQTALVDGRTSIASVAVAYARQIFDRFDDKTVLCIGAGKMAALAIRGFEALKPGSLRVCNRDPDKARDLAVRHGGEGHSLESLDEVLPLADVVITSTGATEPILTVARVRAALRKRRYKPIFVLDIAVPRDVEPDVAGIENVYLYNLDDLQKVIDATHTGRRSAVEQARGIVAEQVDEFLASLRTREVGPMIERLYQRSHALAQEELQRTLGKLPGVSEAEKQHLDELTRRIVNKLLHDPIQALRSGQTGHASASQYLHALERLYKLGDSDTGSDDPAGRP